MKRTLKKTGALLLAAGLAVSSTVPAMAKDKEEQITLTIWHQSVADTDPVKKIIEDSVEEYHELHPNVTIEQDGVTGEQYKNKNQDSICSRRSTGYFLYVQRRKFCKTLY